MTEPILRPDDLEAWDILQRQASVHARTAAHGRRVDRARRVIDEAPASADPWCAMWSGGKDSTVMVHLLRGRGVLCISEKDDLDYPGEREYVERIAMSLELDLRIVEPPVSAAEVYRREAATLGPSDDIHGRAAALSKECFYSVVEAAALPFAGIFLGLRSQESRYRAVNRATRGTLYRRASGQWTATPLADWSGIDVYAYAVAHDLPLFDVYRCLGLLHRAEPWTLRKSWWVPGASARFGGVVWLRRYYPSLYRRLCEWSPWARVLG